MNQITKDEILKEKRSYYNTWRKNNKDKVKKHQENYWKKRTEKIKNEENTNDNSTNNADN